jgi:nucleotide-binding universal stress UspA family protein
MAVVEVSTGAQSTGRPWQPGGDHDFATQRMVRMSPATSGDDVERHSAALAEMATELAGSDRPSSGGGRGRTAHAIGNPIPTGPRRAAARLDIERPPDWASTAQENERWQTIRCSVLLASDDSIAARAAEAWLDQRALVTAADRSCPVRGGSGGGRHGLAQSDSATRACAGRWTTSTAPSRRVLWRLRRQVARRLHDASGSRPSGHAAHGEAAREILVDIERTSPDLVAVGRAGGSDFSAALLGTVTQQLLSHSTVPVLVARPGGMLAGPLPQTLVLMVSGTLAVKGAIDWLLRAGWLSDTRVVIAGLLGASPGLEPPQRSTSPMRSPPSCVWPRWTSSTTCRSWSSRMPAR